ncbi:MAG TPA: TlpA disulfide reductase family protein [Candidatus Limnocylindrales bacterium]|nr:TlpA disulfide reductase family protein [Candidatus Limnocylindrales bacterium]
MSSNPSDRRARRRAAREEAGRTAAGRSTPSRWLLPGLVVAAVVIAAVLAVILPGSSRPSTGGSSSVAPSASGGVSPAASGAVAVGEPSIAGEALPQFEGPDGDAAVGMPAPTVDGADFTGKRVSIAADGRPKVIVFLAHWCPHCQAAVPLLQTWVSAGGVPDGVDLVSVATGIDPSRPNYPPEAWLQREGWTVPVIADTTNSVAQAYGLPAYPYWVFVGADGRVSARTVGEITIPDLETSIGRLTGG